jgi:hypothetical protein
VRRLEMRLKHPLAIRWCHWVNFPLLALMIWSGLWIYWANDVYRLGLSSFTLFRFFPEGFYRTFGMKRKLIFVRFAAALSMATNLVAAENLRLNSRLNYSSDSQDGPLITGDHIEEGAVRGKPNYVFMFGEG